MIEYKETCSEFKIQKVKEDPLFKKSKIKSSKDAYQIVSKFYQDDLEIYESFFCLFLNRVNNTIGWCKISQGGVAGTVVDPKIVAKYAVDMMASGLIVVHNHPSGNLNPSQADRILTKKLKEGLNFLDIKLLDHLIISSEGYYSFGDEFEL